MYLCLLKSLSKVDADAEEDDDDDGGGSVGGDDASII
mgnify:CR=1 FL=1